MILSNLALICVAGFMYGLEQLLFGPLRQMEIEQLYERGWFAITEWLFAMSTFRDEFGVWFLTMFTVLFIGKIWGWIAEGRIETLEQQPPANPRLFHTRLVASLLLYAVFAAQMFWYCADTVVYEARPGVMVMFVFEFAIILISAISIILRYMLWWEEHHIIKKQMKLKIEEIKATRRAAREQAEAQAKEAQEQQVQAQAGAAASASADGAKPAEDAESAETTPAPAATAAVPEALPHENDEIDEDEIEVPGWEAKGTWLFALDIGTGMHSAP
jgi:E3 ubiquitin-protein ligase synoviolin